MQGVEPGDEAEKEAEEEERKNGLVVLDPGHVRMSVVTCM